MTALEPRLSVRAVQPLVAGLDVLGIDTDTVLARALVRRTELDHPDGRIAHSTVMRLWRSALEISGDDDLGLHLAEAAPMASFTVHAYALGSSPTLRDAFRLACRYHRLIHESTRLELIEGPSRVELRHSLPDGDSVPRQPAEFLAATWLRFGRLVAGVDWLPPAVRFAHPRPADISEHRRIFGHLPDFSSGITALTIDPAALDLPNPSRDDGLLAVLDRYATGLLELTSDEPTLAERVRQELATSLERGQTTAEQVAGHLHLSSRSLSRGLKREGTTFRAILDRLRHERATAWLSEDRHSVAEVAFLLGYSEVSAFHRAFTRWADMTPAAYRRRAMDGH